MLCSVSHLQPRGLEPHCPHPPKQQPQLRPGDGGRGNHRAPGDVQPLALSRRARQNLCSQGPAGHRRHRHVHMRASSSPGISSNPSTWQHLSSAHPTLFYFLLLPFPCALAIHPSQHICQTTQDKGIMENLGPPPASKEPPGAPSGTPSLPPLPPWLLVQMLMRKPIEC